MAKNRNIVERLFHIEAGISLAQWAYDRIANNWQLLIALLGGPGVMSYLAWATETIAALGPVFIGGIGIGSGLIIWLVLSWAQLIRAKAKERLINAAAMNKWQGAVDDINPLDQQFHKKRLRFADLAHPLSKRIKGKRFTDCELMGPANIVLLGTSSMNIEEMAFCDVVVLQAHTDVLIHNVIVLEDTNIMGGSVWNCTIFIPPRLVPTFAKLGAQFLTLTGDPEIDSPPQQGTE